MSAYSVEHIPYLYRKNLVWNRHRLKIHQTDKGLQGITATFSVVTSKRLTRAPCLGPLQYTVFQNEWNAPRDQLFLGMAYRIIDISALL